METESIVSIALQTRLVVRCAPETTDLRRWRFEAPGRKVYKPVPVRANPVRKSSQLIAPGSVELVLEDRGFQPRDKHHRGLSCDIDRRIMNGRGYLDLRALCNAFDWWKWRDRWGLRLPSIGEDNAKQGNRKNADRH